MLFSYFTHVPIEHFFRSSFRIFNFTMLNQNLFESSRSLTSQGNLGLLPYKCRTTLYFLCWWIWRTSTNKQFVSSTLQRNACVIVPGGSNCYVNAHVTCVCGDNYRGLFIHGTALIFKRPPDIFTSNFEMKIEIAIGGLLFQVFLNNTSHNKSCNWRQPKCDCILILFVL